MTGTEKSTVNYTCIWLVVFSLVQSITIAENPVALFVFGDSIFDAGNNFYADPQTPASFWPYGETFFGHPTGRCTNGRTIPDFIMNVYGVYLVNPPYLKPDFNDYTLGANFAFSGAGVLTETHQGYVRDLITQLEDFNKVEKQLRQKLGSKEETNIFLSSAVYLFNVGVNDYIDAFDKNPSLFHSQHALEDYVRIVIGNLTNVIQEVHKKGGRKFGFLNLWHVGCAPAFRAHERERKHGCAEELGKGVELHNEALSHALQNLAHNWLDGFKYSLLDFSAHVSQMLDNPSQYGFREVKMACCGSGPYRGYASCGIISKSYELCDEPNEFLYFDPIHPTEKVYRQLAELFWNGNSNMTLPYSLKQLFEAGKESFGFQAS